jgi:site-specific recombinase XerD
MGKPFAVKVVGPLEPYVTDYRGKLLSLGYSPWSATAHLHVMRHLSQWLADRGLSGEEFTESRLAEFVEERRKQGYAKGQTANGMVRVLTAFLLGAGAIPAEVPRVPATPDEELLDSFTTYLREERGLAARTIHWCRYVAGAFLASQRLGEDGPRSISAKDVDAFMRAESEKRGALSLNSVATSLRAFLRFLYVAEHTPTALAAAIPWSPCWRDSGITLALAVEEVEKLLASCDRDTVAGRRDLAILTLLWRLGLRACEVAALRLEDIDWRNGEIMVRGKGNRRDALPLPTDVGEALAEHMLKGAQRGDDGALFQDLRAPHRRLTSTGVSAVVLAASRRAGLPPVRAHRLRHSAATAMRRAGAPLFEIGQVLRHRHTVTTAGYAKEDPDALLQVARPWPGVRS